MRSLLQDLRAGVGTLYRSAKSSAIVALIVMLTVSIDAGSFVKLGRNIICHCSCSTRSQAIKGALDMLKFSSHVLNNELESLPPIKWLGN